MYKYEIRFEETKKQVELIVDSNNDKEVIKTELITLLNKTLQIMERMVFEEVRGFKSPGNNI